MPRHPRLTTLASAAVLAAGFAAVFVVPWRLTLGTPAPVVADSYALGFDNRVAMLGMLLTCAALFALGLPRLASAEGPLVLAEAAPREERVSGRLVALAFAASLVSALFFAWLAIEMYRYGEKNYFLDRLAYVVAGFAPYRDVEFTYGPLLIGLPAGLARVLRPLGISTAEAYSAAWVASFVAGVPLLAWCVNRLALNRGARNGLFAAVAVVAVVNETVGMNGLLLRFLMPAAALLAVHGAAWTRGRMRPLHLAGAVALAGAAGLGVSPEVGIAVLAGSAVYVASIGRRQPVMLAAAPALAVGPLLAAAAFGTGALRHLTGMAGGALNFPVLPGPPILLPLAAAAAVAALLPRHLGRADGSGAAALALATAGGLMLLGALGRADSSHAYFYSLTLVLLAAPLLAASAPRALAPALLAFAAVFLAAHALSLTADYRAAIVSAAAGRGGVSREELRVVASAVGEDPAEALRTRARLRAAPASAPDVERFARFAPLAAPAGFRDGLGLALAERGWLAPAYYRGVPFTPAQLETHLASLARSRHLVVPEDLGRALASQPAQPARTMPSAWTRRLGGERYGALMMWPGSYEVRRETPDLYAGLVRWLARRYRPVATVGGYTVLERRE